MKILYLVDKYPIEGEPKQGKYPLIYKKMVERGHQVIMIAHSATYRGNLLTFRKSSSHKRSTNGSYVIELFLNQFVAKAFKLLLRIPIINNPINNFLSYIPIRQGFLAARNEILENGMPDIIHAWGEDTSTDISLMLNKRFKIPFVINIHGVPPIGLKKNSKKGLRIREIFEHCNLILPVSKPLGEYWQTTFNINKNKIKVIPNLVDENLFNILKNNHQNNITIIFHVSKLYYYKDIPNLIAAFAIAFEGKPFELRLAGQKKLNKGSMLAIRKYKISKQVKFIGKLSQTEVINEMQSCDFYVQSSRTETFGIPLVEAMMCGKPVVSTVAGGPESYIVSECGEIVPKEDSQALANSMNYIASNLDNFKPTKIRQYAIKCFGVDNVCKLMEDVYSMVLQSKNPNIN